jgi:hypothetical protein
LVGIINKLTIYSLQDLPLSPIFFHSRLPLSAVVFSASSSYCYVFQLNFMCSAF